MIPNGIHEGLSFEQYAAIPALNASSIVPMRRSPFYYKFCRDTAHEETDSMRLGTVTHVLVLEPERVKEFAVWGLHESHKVRRGQTWDAFQLVNANYTIVTANEYETAKGIAAAVNTNAPARKYIRAAGRCEVSMVWDDPATGRKCKARIDKLCDDGTIIDLKSTRSCRPYRFGSQSYELAYHIKAYFYCSGYQTLTGKKPKFKWVAVESKPPYESAVYRATPDVLMQGGLDLDGLLRQLDECERDDRWPAEMADESDLILPSYAMTSPEDVADLEYVEEESVDGLPQDSR